MRLTRYIAAEVARGYLLAALALGALLSVMALVQELEDIGVGTYTFAQSVFVVGASLPSQLLTWLPFVALFGTLYGLAELLAHNELNVVRAAGWAPWRLTAAALLPAMISAVAVVPLDEFWAAPQYREAMVLRSLARARDGDVLPTVGFWARRLATRDAIDVSSDSPTTANEAFANVAQLEAGRYPKDVRVYEFVAGRLVRVTQAEQARPPRQLPEPGDSGIGSTWHLDEITLQELGARQWRTRTLPTLAWQPLWDAAVPIAPLPVASLSLPELSRLITQMRANAQPAMAERSAYWRRLLLPLTVLALALLAVPFSTGTGRTRRGARLGLALACGLACYLLDRVILNVGLLRGWDPRVLALTPVVLAVVAWQILTRRWRT